MTLKELSQLYYLNLLIARHREKLQEIEDNLGLGAMNYDGMPRNPSPKNKIEILTARKVDLEREIERLEAESERIKRELEHSIEQIGDYQIQLILTHRFVDLMDWGDVAVAIGGRNTEASVKQACYRFIKKTKNIPKVVPNVPNVPR